VLNLPTLPALLFEGIVQRALEEDLGLAGDRTSQSVVPADRLACVQFTARQDGCIAGMDVVKTTLRLVDPDLVFDISHHDGSWVKSGDIIAQVQGNAGSIVTAERVCLNFLGHLSGIATATGALVGAVKETKTRICCTRKTTPGLRLLEKYAVLAGGGVNHRFGLGDGILIKDNHIAMAGGVESALKAAQESAGHMVSIEIEVDNLDQLETALAAGARIVLLDNMPAKVLAQAVEINQSRALLEASGNITLDTAAEIAATGVDFISCGWITHSAPCLDIGLDFVELTST
jgi:nicotinate-nucleotide pyrophosphorylase (carboxylating)